MARGTGESSGVTRKILLTVATGGLTFLITNALDQPQATSITLSVLIGGIALLTRFLADFEKRLAALEKIEGDSIAEMRHLIDDTFPQISRATELYRMIDTSALGATLVTELVDNSARISPDSPQIVQHFVRAKIQETSGLLKQISEGGTITYYGEDREWLLGLTRNATTGIDAISMAAVDHSLWQSEIGQRYLDAQRRAAASGRRVRRIFVLDTAAGADDPDLLRVCAEQARMGIRARLLARPEVPPHQRVQVRDLIVFDDTLAYETTPTLTADPQLAQISETRLVLTTDRVKQCVQLFSDLWEVAFDPKAVT
ncbi:DUF6879 family protein [Winogradskya humida]|uniref:DUF6879 domain-containing protein n=1 Tax=Winogradskya humida TaxID=113566 RepID=A0ABQ3ZZI0_9ACTN|nr:DUF6879 family protein [Actinoplanes humidus]GIE24010.1 hypothetical protein Ahu01nite_071120 [Actinoplanes humidus]